ncbi:MAG: nucleoside deaminase [Saprospiraceae bacterium]
MFPEEYFMQQAFRQAEKAFDEGEVPVGAVIVCNDLIIAKAHNQTELLTDVTAHAEIIALTSASEYLGSKYLQECTMYVTLEPCVMCAGALAWAQLGRLVFGASDEKKGFFRYGKELLHPKTVVLQGVMETQCGGLMTEFFKRRR